MATASLKAARWVLAVDEGRDVLPVGVAVRHHDLDVLSLQVYRLVERGLGHVFLDQVQESVLGLVHRAVEVEGQPFLEIGIVLNHRLHEVHVELVGAEHLAVGSENDQGAVLLGDGFLDAASGKLPAFVAGPGTPAVAERLYVELLGKGVDCLGSDSVQSDGFLEHLVVELASGVELAGGLHHRAERYPSPEVPDAHLVVFYLDDDLLAESCREFVDAVVNDLFEEHVDSVPRVGTVPETADVHPRTPADVFHSFESLYVGFRVFVVLLVLCHVIVA